VAAAGGHLGVASRLVIAGCHVGSQDAAGHAAGHLAAAAGHEAVLAKVLAAGYEVCVLCVCVEGGGWSGLARCPLPAALRASVRLVLRA
jgi:hypothetical protein